MDTSGFYKQLDDGSWHYAPNFVYSPTYTLKREGDRQSIDGWHWHEEAPLGYRRWKLEQQLEKHDADNPPS